MKREKMWVNPIKGGFNAHVVDIRIPCRGSELIIERYYDSHNENSNNVPWDKWVFGHDEHLRFGHDQSISVIYPQSYEDRFVKSAEDTYVPSTSKNLRCLIKNHDGTYTLTFPSMGRHTFRPGDGRLVKTEDAHGNTFTYEWTPVLSPPAPRAWDLVSITDPSGRRMEIFHTENIGQNHRLDFNWDGSTLISYIFGYEFPDLKYVIDQDNNQTSYEYGSEAPALLLFLGLKKVTFPNGGWVENLPVGPRPLGVLVGRQVFSNGRVISYEYDRKNLRTTITDGDRVTIYQYDDHWNITSVTDPAGYINYYQYDGDNRLTAAIDPRLGVKRYSYNDRGKVISYTDPLDNVTPCLYDTVFKDVVMQIAGPADPEQRITTLALDPLTGDTLAVTNPMGDTTTMQYDQYGQMVNLKRPEGNEESFGYDAYGNMIWKRDGLGNLYRYSHDSLGRLASVTNPLGFTTRIVWQGNRTKTVIDAMGNSTTSIFDSSGNIVTSIDPLGSQTLYEFDQMDNLVKVNNAAGEITTYEYNLFLERTKVTDARGNSTVYAHDEIGRIASITAPDGTITSFTYIQSCGETVRTDARGNQRRQLRDLLCRLTRVILEDGSYVTYEYNAYGNIVKKTDPLGYVTTTEYNKLGLPTSTTDPLGNRTQSEYDKNGNLVSSTDKMGAVTTDTYDAADRKICVQYPDGSRVESTFDPAGSLTATKNQLGKLSTFAYDKAGRLVRTYTPLGEETVRTLDALGRVTAVKSPSGRITTFEYDALSRRVAVTDPIGNTTRSSFDASGNLVTVVDALGNAIHCIFDSMSRMTTLVDPEQGATGYSYDPSGNLTAVEDPNGNLTSYTFDQRSRLTVELFADGTRTELTYDANGNVEQAETQRSENISYAHDALGRMTKITYPDTGDTTFEYDKNGNRTKMKDSTGETFFTFDVMGRLTKKTNPDGKAIQYGYDLAGRLTSMFYPDGSKVSYEYDDDGRLTAMIDGQGESTRYQYNPDGQLLRTDYPNGAYAISTYDAAGRLETLHHYNSTGTAIVSQELDYNSAGNITSIHDGATTLWAYEYDRVSRLTAATNSLGETTLYSYDPAGNMLTRTLPDLSVIRYEYNSLNQLIRAGDTIFQYDAAGNLFKKISAQGVTRYNFNADGRLIRIAHPDCSETNFTYNADQELVMEIDGHGNVFRYLWSGPNKIAEYDDSALLVRFYYGLGMVAARYSQFKRFFHQDYLGSVAELTDQQGISTDAYSYDPWGEPISSSGSTPNVFRFAGILGVEWNSDAELYYMRARWYDQNIGRYISRDPLDTILGISLFTKRPPIRSPRSIEHYKYASNNPIVKIDPSGLIARPVLDARLVYNFGVIADKFILAYNLIVYYNGGWVIAIDFFLNESIKKDGPYHNVETLSPTQRYQGTVPTVIPPYVGGREWREFKYRPQECFWYYVDDFSVGVFGGVSIEFGETVPGTRRPRDYPMFIPKKHKK